MIRSSAFLLSIALAATSLTPALAQRSARLVPDDLRDPRWMRYADSESGTALDFPRGIFTAESPLEKGRGKRFRTADGRAELDVYSLSNDKGETPRGYVARRLMVDPKSLDYKRVTRRFFVVSGIHEDRVFYSRCNFTQRRRGAMHCILMAYPQSETRAWDGIVTRISLTLRAAKPGETTPAPPAAEVSEPAGDRAREAPSPAAKEN